MCLKLQVYVILAFATLSYSYDCPEAAKYGPGPPKTCDNVVDPLKKPKSELESWFTREMFYDLFPKANLGYGAKSDCSPYSYESFVIAARYFPEFGTEYITKNPAGATLYPPYNKEQTNKRDISAFFAHSVQETGENDASLYNTMPEDEAKQCFYRGGLYNWFEGGPSEGCYADECLTPEGGVSCQTNGLYWATDATNMYFWPPNEKKKC